MKLTNEQYKRLIAEIKEQIEFDNSIMPATDAEVEEIERFFQENPEPGPVSPRAQQRFDEFMKAFKEELLDPPND